MTQDLSQAGSFADSFKADATLHDPLKGDWVPHQPFGTYPLSPWRDAIRRFGRALMPRRFPRLGSILNWPIWRLSLIGRRGPVDLQPYPGFTLRLYPRENHADTKCYARPALCDLGEERAIARCAHASADRTFYMVDVGANTGTYSVLGAHLAWRAGKTARLVCIEANPKTQNRLAENLAFSGLTGHVDLVASAVSDAPGVVQLDTATWNLGSVKVTQSTNRLKASKCVAVPARTLSSILDDAQLPRIDFLKIDIEGHEVQALAPFLAKAPDHLLPAMVLAETKHDKGDALRKLLLEAGYKATLEGRSDTVFERACAPS